jgi:aspartate/methionine/tyrosine aminotransferase
VHVDDVWLGNGVSELIVMALQAMLDNGDEVLIPAPDYPLWTAATSLAGGTPRHYLCDESQGWLPDIDDLRSKITNRTKAIVVINPNNPTGAVYPGKTLEDIAELARQHGLTVLSDEIYDKILYDDAEHLPPRGSAWPQARSGQAPRRPSRRNRQRRQRLPLNRHRLPRSPRPRLPSRRPPQPSHR